MWVWLVMMILYLGANGYLCWRLLSLVESWPLWTKIAIVVLIAALSLMLFMVIGLRDAGLPEAVMRSMFNIGSAWMVFMLYAILTITLFDILHWVVPSLRYGTPIALVLTIFILLVGYLHYRHPSITRYEFRSEKIASPRRIVAISDVHLGYGTDRQSLERYVALINAQDADMVLIVGDLIDNSVRPVVAQHMEEVLNRISAPDGVFMVVGNHEYISGIEASEEFLSKTNIKVLRDSVARVGDIAIVGRDDAMNRERQSLSSLMPAEGYTVVLDHQPSSIEESVAQGADLHLSGHTHRGQVWPLSWVTDAIYEQSHGHRKWRNSEVIVTTGLSLWGPPFRIGTDSELVLVDLLPK